MIYLDNAASTPPLPLAQGVFYANPSAPHGLGIEAERALTQARTALAEILCCTPGEVTFTSGGTEANNLAITGFVHAHAHAHRKKNRDTGQLPLLLAEPWAHPSVLSPLRHAEEAGLATVQVAPVSEWKLGAAHNALACLSHANHETGDLCDIAATAQALKAQHPNTVVLTDGAQGFCKHADGAYAASDLYTFSGHKCHAPTGIGGLMVRKNIRLAPLLHGGNQENGLRSGTENVAAAVHLAQAAQFLHTNHEKFSAYAARLRDLLADLRNIPGVTGNALTPNPSPYILNLSFPGTRGEVLVHMLSERKIYVSMGAACKSRNKRGKSSLALMGFPQETAESALRFSFSHRNTPVEIVETKKALAECVAQMRRVSGWQPT